MKHILLFTYLFVMLFVASCKKDTGNSSPVVQAETLIMGSGYANDVFYSATTGVVSIASRNTWDIAFDTNLLSATIITNNASGVKLFTYPLGDTTVWNTVNITNVAAWAQMYNSDTTWTFGSFEQNTLHGFDYGWSVYNQQNHQLVGDSLFVIQLQDNTYRKLWMRKKISTENKYIFTIANSDGNGSVTDTVDCSLYTKKNFIYFSLATNKIVDREPDADAWDFVATRYITKIPTGPGSFMEYPVTGILNNAMTVVNNINNTVTTTGSFAAKMENTSVDNADFTKAIFKTSISGIGYDWKANVAQTANYTIVPRIVYFLKTRAGKVYKIVFTGFDSATGQIQFNQTLVN